MTNEQTTGTTEPMTREQRTAAGKERWEALEVGGNVLNLQMTKASNETVRLAMVGHPEDKSKTREDELTLKEATQFVRAILEELQCIDLARAALQFLNQAFGHIINPQQITDPQPTTDTTNTQENQS